jgi:hypothetical protein
LNDPHARELISSTKIKTSERRQIVFELIHERNTGWNVHLNDLLVRNPIKELDESSKAIPVRNNQDSLSIADRWRDAPVPVGE